MLNYGLEPQFRLLADLTTRRLLSNCIRCSSSLAKSPLLTLDWKHLIVSLGITSISKNTWDCSQRGLKPWGSGKSMPLGLLRAPLVGQGYARYVRFLVGCYWLGFPTPIPIKPSRVLVCAGQWERSRGEGMLRRKRSVAEVSGERQRSRYRYRCSCMSAEYWRRSPLAASRPSGSPAIGPSTTELPASRPVQLP